MKLNRVHRAIVGSTFWLLPLSAAAQTGDDRIRQLYASAEYEQALEAIGGAADATAQQYKALCLLALGRTADAESSVVALVSAFPDFVVSDADVPPRFVAMVGRVRSELLPAVLRRQFAQARELFQAKAYDRALAAFDRLMALSSDREIRQADGVEDLRLLAAGFIDLAKTTREPAAPSTGTGATPAAAASRAAAPVSTPPVMRRQVLPPWPNEAGRPIFQPVGSVRLQINSAGRVVSAAMIKGLHPSYDQRLLAAALDWEYTPATLNGNAVDSESVVEVRIALPPR